MRNHAISIRVDDDELARLTHLAQTDGRSLSNWIRHQLLPKPTFVPASEENVEAYLEAGTLRAHDVRTPQATQRTIDYQKQARAEQAQRDALLKKR